MWQILFHSLGQTSQKNKLGRQTKFNLQKSTKKAPKEGGQVIKSNWGKRGSREEGTLEWSSDHKEEADRQLPCREKSSPGQ